jgi:hypothetical protein
MSATRAERALLKPALALLLALIVAAGCSTAEPSSNDPTVAPNTSASAATSEPTPSESADAALDADDIFDASVSGYEFVEVPKRLQNGARRQFYASSGLSRRDARVDLQSITKDDAGVGVLLVVTMSPEMTALPGTNARGFAVGIAQSASTRPDKVNLGPTTGYVIDNDGQIFVAWQHENLLIALIGDDRADSVAAARAVAEATAS